MAEPAQQTGRSWPVRLDAKRRPTLPAAVLDEAGIDVHETLLAHAEDQGRIVLETRAAVLRRMQKRFADGKRATGAKGSPVDSLLADRAAEVTMES